MKHRVLLLAAGLLLIVPLPVSADASNYASAVLADAPVGYWKLDETSGVTAFDSSGNDKHGTYTGGFAVDQEGGFAGGRSVSFDGTTGYIALPGNWGGGSEVTVEAWINVQAAASPGVFQAIVSSTAATFVQLQANNLPSPIAVNAVYVNAPAISIGLPITPEMPIDTWRHVALTAKSGDLRVYVDGTQLGATEIYAFGTVSESIAVRIASGFASARFFEGRIDDVAIYNRALTQQELLDHIAAAAQAEVPTISHIGLGALAGLLAVVLVVMILWRRPSAA